MFSRRTQASRLALFVVDQALLAVALAAACIVHATLVSSEPWTEGVARWQELLLPIAPIMAVALAACGFYRPGLDPRRPRTGEGWEPLWGGFVAMAVVLIAGPLLVRAPLAAEVTRGLAYIMMGTASAALALSRLLVRATGHALNGDTETQLRLLVFGMSPRMLRLLATLRRATHMRLQLLGVAADDVPRDVGSRLSLSDAMDMIEQGRVDQVLVDAGGLQEGQLDEILGAADREGISVHITSAMFPATHLLPTWERVGGVPLLGFVSAELSLGARLAKRSFDIAVASVLLTVTAVPMALIVMTIWVTSPGRALHVQERVGTRGKIFRLFKFRTMRMDAERHTGPVWAVENDPRCTRFGALLRRTNLDELPQLFNVLLGHMSLVGPRPERPEFVKGFKKRIPRYAHKHWVKPGITGWAQIHGLRGSNTSLTERVDHDLYYVENWSLMLDLRILVRTLFDGYLNAA